MSKYREITAKEMYHLLEKNPSRFCIRTKIWKNFEYGYISGSDNLHAYKEIYKWPHKVNLCIVIEKTLEHYNYDLGIWTIRDVVEYIYNDWGKLIDKLHSGWATNPKLAKREFIARGFKNGIVVPKGETGWITSISTIDEHFYWPDPGRMGIKNGDDDLRPYIYDLHRLVGIAGFTQVYLARKYKN